MNDWNKTKKAQKYINLSQQGEQLAKDYWPNQQQLDQSFPGKKVLQNLNQLS